MLARGLGLIAGVLADRVFGDPQRHHPVAWWAGGVQRAEQLLYRDQVAAGAALVAATTLPLAVAGVCAERRGPLARFAATAVTTWAVLGSRSLEHEALIMADALDRADLVKARSRLPHLCGREPDQLGVDELARATVESVAENSCDAVVAPLLWGAVAGVPGMLVHRGVNTLDAMVGHRSARYEKFGKVAARLDDAMAYLPARFTGLLACLASPEPRQAWQVMWRDHGKHPSPNGGWPESAWAGGLGVQLGGRNVYPGGVVSERGRLGDGEPATAAAIRPAVGILRRVVAGATVTAVAASALLAGLRRWRR